MNVINGVWHDANVTKPKSGEQVLCVKRLKCGRKELCFGSWHEDLDRLITSGGNNNVIFWMPLPEIPEKEMEQHGKQE